VQGARRRERHRHRDRSVFRIGCAFDPTFIRLSVRTSRSSGNSSVLSRESKRPARSDASSPTVTRIALIEDGWRSSSSNLLHPWFVLSLVALLSFGHIVASALRGRTMLLLPIADLFLAASTALCLLYTILHDLLASYFIQQRLSRNTPILISVLNFLRLVSHLDVSGLIFTAYVIMV